MISDGALGSMAARELYANGSSIRPRWAHRLQVAGLSSLQSDHVGRLHKVRYWPLYAQRVVSGFRAASFSFREVFLAHLEILRSPAPDFHRWLRPHKGRVLEMKHSPQRPL